MKRFLPFSLFPLLTIRAETGPLDEAIQPRTEDSVWQYAAYDHIDGNFRSGGTATEKVVEEIEVPAGAFRTVVYETEYPDAENPQYAYRDRYYMTPGVGLVRFEMDDPDGEGGWTLVYREDLVSYSMGEEAETGK